MKRGINGHIDGGSVLRHLAAAGLVAALAVPTGGCSTLFGEGIQAERKVIVTEAFACETIGNAEKKLAPFVVKMDDRAVATLNAARGVARPWCGSPTPPSNVTAATAALVDAAGRFSALKAEWVK